MDRFGGGSSGRGRMCIGIGTIEVLDGTIEKRKDRAGAGTYSGQSQASAFHFSPKHSNRVRVSVLRPQGRTSERMGVTCASSFLFTEDFAIRHS